MQALQGLVVIIGLFALILMRSELSDINNKIDHLDTRKHIEKSDELIKKQNKALYEAFAILEYLGNLKIKPTPTPTPTPTEKPKVTYSKEYRTLDEVILDPSDDDDNYDQ